MLSLVSPPSGYPITLDDVKDHSRIEIPDDDILISGLIAAAVDFVEYTTGRALLTQVWDYYIDELPCETLEIPKPPLQEIVSVKYLDADKVEQTLVIPDYYKVIAPQGPKAMPGMLVPTYLTNSIRWRPAYRREHLSTVIRFRCGYGSAEDEAVPDLIKLAMLEFVGDAYENRENSIVTTTNTAASAIEVPLSIKTLLWPFVVDKLGF